MPKNNMTPVRKAFGVTETEALADRQVRVVISTGQIDRSGDVVVQAGISVANFKASRTVLWNHDQDHPVAQCIDIGVKAGRLEALVQFPDAGISAKADEVYGLLKAGVINAASIGFLPLDVEPVDGRNPRKGLRIDTSELLEFSFVSVPANPGAQVVERSYRGAAASVKITLKGLYGVAALAQILQSLGYQVDASAAEAAREGDGSPVPDQMKDALHQLGAVLINMTTEEVGELLGAPDGDDGLCCDSDYMMYALRGGSTKGLNLKAGRKFSKATVTAVSGHLGAIADAHAAMTKMFAEDPGDSDDDDTTEKARRAAVVKAKSRVRETETMALKSHN